MIEFLFAGLGVVSVYFSGYVIASNSLMFGAFLGVSGGILLGVSLAYAEYLGAKAVLEAVEGSNDSVRRS